MAISDSVQRFTSKARDVAGAVSAISDFPGIPEGIRNSIQSIFGTGTGLAPSQNRRDLNNFLGATSKLNGFTRPSYFYIEIAPPPMLRDESETARNLAFLCESANLPGIAFATSDIKRYGYGPIEKKPYLPMFTDTTMTFFADGAGVVQSFFYKWMNGIVKFDGPPYGSVQNIGGTSMAPFEVNYKERYSTDILITTVDELNNDIINVRLTEAFPIFMGDVSLSWNDTDQISRIPVQFTYFNWKIERINVNQIPSTIGQEGFLQKIIRVGTAVQTLATIRKPNNVADIINVVNNAKIAIGGLRF